MHHIDDKQNGLSLIELMFVIIVMAIAALSTVQVLRQRNTNRTVDLTTFEANTIIQAAQSYYARFGKKWPQDIDEMIDKGFLSEDNRCTPWLVASPDDPGHCGSFSDYQIELPDSRSQSKYLTLKFDVTSAEVAEAIAAQVPSSLIAHSTKVYLYTPAPGPLNYDTSGLIIKNIEVIETKGDDTNDGSDDCKDKDGIYADVKKVSCPPGWSPNYAGMFFYLKNSLTIYNNLGSDYGAIDKVKLYRETDEKDSNAAWNVKPDSDHWGIAIRMMTSLPYSLAGFVDGFQYRCKEHKATVISYCVPPNYNPYTTP